MLLRHSLLYLLARGLPGAVNFLAIAVYTRLLAPEEYGRYALVVAGVGFFNGVFFQWLRLSLLRFFPAHLKDPKPLFSTILAGFVALILLTGGIGLILIWICPDQTLKKFFLLGVFLLWAQAWFELNLELYRNRLQPLHYGLMNGVRAVGALALGTLLATWGFGAFGPLIGILVAMVLVGLWGAIREWADIDLRAGFSWIRLKPMMVYGLPFIANFALGFVVSSSDRFMLAWLLNEKDAGIYSAGYDLVWNTLGMLSSVVNLAAYPLIVRAIERGGTGEAIRQLEQNVTLLLAIILPSTVGLTILVQPISSLLLGPSFREVALILPAVALANLVFSLKVHHADLAYQLSKKTQFQIGIAALAALVKMVLNLWWIPLLGIAGAAYATLVAYTVAMIASFVIGMKYFPIPMPIGILGKLAVATTAMTVTLIYLRDLFGENCTMAELLLMIGFGAITYGISVFFMGIGRSHTLVQNLLVRLRGRK